MFVNKTAWFSKSCDSEAKALWVHNGGALAGVNMAHFVFSDDWECSDTIHLYSSDAYLKQHLAVFSAQYVLDAIRISTETVLGKYFLVPPDIKERIKTRRSDKSSLKSLSDRTSQSPVIRRSDQPVESQTNKADSPRSRLSPKKSPRQPQPAAKNLLSTRPSNALTDGASEKQLSVASTSRQGQENISGFPRAIDFESIPHVQNLPKVIGCLGNICPGKQGVEVKYKETVKKGLELKYI